MILDPWHVFSSSFGMMPKPYTAFVTLLALGVYFALTLNVARARGRFKVTPPDTDGPQEFRRVYRVQQNTLEQMALFLPLLWLAAFSMGDLFAASFGCLWPLSRIIYARGYYDKAKRRSKGFIIGIFVNLVLFLGALAGVIGAF